MLSLKAKLGEGKKTKQLSDKVMDAQGCIAPIFKTWEPEAKVQAP